MTRDPFFRRTSRAFIVTALLALVAACATSVLQDAQGLSAAGQHEQALHLIDDALSAHPQDNSLRAARVRERELAVTGLVRQADTQRLAGRLADAAALVERARALDPQHPRVLAASEELARDQRHDAWLAQARLFEQANKPREATELLQRIAAEAPGHAGARAMLLRLRDKAAADAPPASLGPAFQKPLTLDFRDAPLRNVLESLGRTHGVNFVFDRDVKGDAKVSVFLKDVSIDDALKVILSTQQLDRKLLNDSTVLIYPNTQQKQREHQDLVTRTFYLNTADVKQAQALVRTIAKTRDLHVDERLNLMVLRDTPEVMKLVERLIASIDLPDPEVVLEVEVLEVASSRVDELGVQWPEQLSWGLPDGGATVELGRHRAFRASIANPAVVATLRETVSRANVLANPRLRARNHEKAKVLIGEKLPVFTTTSTANVGVSASVAYLDVGLKLEVEPSVQLDGEVIMRVNLEVSTLIGKVLGPQGSVAYQVGTRQATTSLRLRDGETQVLAGLIREEDSKGIAGVPGLADTPVIGRLFGVHTDTRNKTEVVLLITPRVVRNIGVTEAAVSNAPAGVDANPGNAPLRLRNSARVAMPIAAGPRGGAGAANAPAATPGLATLALSTSGHADPGGTVSVSLQNRSGVALKGELEYDVGILQPATGGDTKNGRIPFQLAAGAEQAFVLRALPAADGKTTAVTPIGLGATDTSGPQPMVQVLGDGQIAVGRR